MVNNAAGRTNPTAGRRMMKLRIVADDKIPFLRGALEPFAEVTYLPGGAIAPADVKNADALITRTRTRCGEALLAGSRVRFIATATIGYDHIDTAYLRRAGIAWRNAPGCNAASVAQYIGSALVSSGVELCGKTLGVIGVGNVGSKVAALGEALGMRVLAYDLYPNDSGRAIAEYVDLDTLYARADVISLHCNLTPENTGMINKDSIAKMKDGVILINNARGQLIHEQDVADALNSGKMGAAGLDVVYTEPIRGDNPLLKAKNCIITPHISWAPKESRQRIMDTAVENVKAYLAGTPINVVNR